MSKRAKLEAFFTPKPTMHGVDPEDPHDMYSHTHKFFKASKKTDKYAEEIEVGERRIR
jgi:hypothetical protein